MATYLVWSGGNNSSGTEAGGWAAAYIDLQSALTAATSAGDVVKIQYTHQDVPVADKTYTFNESVSVISVNKDSSDALTPMGTTPDGWLGHASSAFSLTLTATGALKIYLYGLTFRLSGSTTETMTLANNDTGDWTFENCRVHSTSTASGAGIFFGSSGSGAQVFVHLKNFTHRVAHANHTITLRCSGKIEGGSIDSGGTAPTVPFSPSNNAGHIEIIGFDSSHCTGALVGIATNCAAATHFVHCKIGNAIVDIDDVMTTQTATNRSGADVWIHDCHTADVQGIFAYANALGLMVSDTSITFTGTAAGQSWKVVGTANATRYSPFYTPWIDRYAASGTLLAYMEILRDGNPAAYTNAEVWLEGSSKTTSGSTKASFLTDRATVLAAGADQDAGSGVGSWSGESANSWSGSLGFLTLSPVEDGYIRCRVAVGGAFTVYVDPVIRS